MKEKLDETGIASLCNRVIVGVAAAFKGRTIDCEKACAIMREEVKAFFFGEAYADERACVLRRSMDDRWIIASIVARCVEKIGGAK